MVLYKYKLVILVLSEVIVSAIPLVLKNVAYLITIVCCDLLHCN